MTADRVAELVLLLVIVSGVPLGWLACRLDPGPLLRRHPADTRGACPPRCTTCTALNEGDR